MNNARHPDIIYAKWFYLFSFLKAQHEILNNQTKYLSFPSSSSSSSVKTLRFLDLVFDRGVCAAFCLEDRGLKDLSFGELEELIGSEE